MISERLGNLVLAANGRLIGGRPELLVNGLFSDTRTPVRGGLFVALRGDNFDGNRFAHDAVEKCGAAAVMIDKPEAANAIPRNAGAILVEDTRQGYLGIAARHRKNLSSALWFGITGSVGKSSTKEMLAHVLEHAAQWRVHKAKGSFNNAVGLSHTILDATRDHHAVVLELGTNHPGEIEQLARVAQPDVALITCAAESHLEAFHTVANVAREKAQILAFQSSDQVAIINADDANYETFRTAARGKLLNFGLRETAGVRARHIRTNPDGTSEFMLRAGDDVADCALQVHGQHQIYNALAVTAAALTAGLSLPMIAAALRSFKGLARRFTLKYSNGVTYIDDAYNANPASFTAALHTLTRYQAARRFVIAGDMLELGANAIDYHRALGRQLAQAELAGLVTVGQMSHVAGAVAVAAGLPAWALEQCETPEAAAEALRFKLREGDVVLVKGSHSMHLDRCLAKLGVA